MRVGIEATGPIRWFERLLAELGQELWIGDSAKIRASEVRKQKTDERDGGDLSCAAIYIQCEQSDHIACGLHLRRIGQHDPRCDFGLHVRRGEPADTSESNESGRIVIATYAYDGFGRRIQKVTGGVTTNYFYNVEDQVVAEQTAAGWSAGYVYFGGASLAKYGNGTTYFMHGDHLGSTHLMTTMAAGVYDNYDYLPFGEQIAGGTGTTHKFTGKERDAESGDDYFGARYYASSTGRFMSPDWSAKEEPVPYAKLENPQSLNLYSYVGNNPLGNVDPDGHACTAWYGNSGWTGSSGFCDRAAEYRMFDANPAINSRTRFFGAAAMVSNSLGDVDAWSLIVRPVGISSQTGSILEGIGRTLQAFNEGESHLVASGALGSGPALDRQLVHNEQTVVQGALNGLKESDSKGYDKAIGEINTALNGLASKGLQELAPSDRMYASILAGVRKDLGRNIDFAKQGDREAIGNAVAQALRGTSSTDSK